MTEKASESQATDPHASNAQMSDLTFPDWYRGGIDHIWRPYCQMKTASPALAVSHTQGAYIHLSDGRRLLDGIASWWSAVHGYNHPILLEAMQKQLHKMPHVMFGGLVHEPALRLAQKLAALAPGDLDRVFFSESGSISVEVALKIALQYHLNRGEKRTKFVHFRGGYHGDSFATMALSDPDGGMHGHFKDFLTPHFLRELPDTAEKMADLAQFLQNRAGDIAGVIIEPLVQGAGGMRFHRPALLKGLRAACDQAGVLLIFDEIFTGFGRTGSLFAADQAGVVPDIMTLSKALTGGVTPLAATIARAGIVEAFMDDDPAKALMHGPTYMAHALGTAAALASIRLFETEKRLNDAARLNRLMSAQLEACRQYDMVVDVRTLGAIGVVQMADGIDLEALKPRFIERGVWVRPFKDVIYLTPALTLDDAQIHRLCTSIVEVIAHCKA